MNGNSCPEQREIYLHKYCTCSSIWLSNRMNITFFECVFLFSTTTVAKLLKVLVQMLALNVIYRSIHYMALLKKLRNQDLHELFGGIVFKCVRNRKQLCLFVCWLVGILSWERNKKASFNFCFCFIKYDWLQLYYPIMIGYSCATQSSPKRKLVAFKFHIIHSTVASDDNCYNRCRHDF